LLDFQALKSLLAQDCLLAYPDPSYVFVIEPDASDYQLGSIVLQNTTTKYSVEEIIKLFTANPSQLPPGFCPIAYFSRKLSAAQRNYVTLEKELLSIVETLIEYRSILLGSPIVAFTDHRNLTFNTNQSQRALRWRLLMEEYNIHLVHRSGSSNHAADALSRLPLIEPEEPISVRQAQARFDDAYHFYPVQNRMQNPSPVSFPTLQRHQRADANLQRTARNNPATFRTVDYGTSSLLQSRQHPNSQSWKIVVPVAVVDEVIKWFHDTLMHPGVQRMLQTIRKHFYFPQMRRRVEEYVRHCDSCQRTKNHHDRAGLLPPKDPETDPWCEVQVDLMGPWQVDVGYNYRLTIHALSCVDPFTGYIEIVRVSNTLSAHVSSKFHNHWLCRYPTPSRCIHDNGPEFVGHEFQDVLRYYGIKDCPTTSKNPQANSIVERAHQTIASMLRNMSYETRTDRRTRLTAEDIDDFIETALSCTQRAINATVHTVTKETPGVLAFHRDMLLPVQVMANWELTRERRANSITRNVLRENSTRRPFNWQPGMQVLISVPGSKIDPKFAGPYTITRVHPNGTVTIRRRPNTFQRINIRRIKLYHAPRV
jgi:transposase InsO family protein